MRIALLFVSIAAWSLGSASTAVAEDPADLPEASKVRAVVGTVREAIRDRAPKSEQAARQVIAAELRESHRLSRGALADLEGGGNGSSSQLLRAERQRFHDLVEQLIDSGKVRPERAAEFRATVDALDAQAALLEQIEESTREGDRAELISTMRKRLSLDANPTRLEDSQPTFRSFSMQPPPAPLQAEPAPEPR